ncbi:MAG: hypothetical protein CM1200mP29_00020 [Verrucomicrobiota bacterium]|nr:MAG: hypothetical protein CM1200mP29_00020 [Verrucomicrobiota bacterium]
MTLANAGRYSVLVSNSFGKGLSVTRRGSIFITSSHSHSRAAVTLGFDPEKWALSLCRSKATLSATPATGYSWMHWRGLTRRAANQTFTVTMDAHKTMTANLPATTSCPISAMRASTIKGGSLSFS